MSFSRADLFTEELSDCCGAPMYSDMEICSDCKEHCSSTISMEEAERDYLPTAVYGQKVSLKKMSGLTETASYFKYLAQELTPLIDKMFDIQSPLVLANGTNPF